MVSGSVKLAPHVLEVKAGRTGTSLLQKTSLLTSMYCCKVASASPITIPYRNTHLYQRQKVKAAIRKTFGDLSGDQTVLGFLGPIVV